MMTLGRKGREGWIGGGAGLSGCVTRCAISVPRNEVGREGLGGSEWEVDPPVASTGVCDDGVGPPDA